MASLRSRRGANSGGAARDLWALPADWSWKHLADVCEPSQYGWTTKAAREGELKFLRTSDISSGRLDWASVPYCSEVPSDVGRYLVRGGDILISRAGSVGKSFLLGEVEPAAFASYLIRYRPRLEPRYVYHWLQTHAYWAQIADNTAGIAVPNVNASKLDRISIPIPPPETQRRIVARIDELFSELDDGEEELARARADLDTYRKALLKAAVTGELTADWREGRPTPAAGTDLIESMLVARLERQGRQSRKRYVEPPRPNVALLPELPEGWAWTTVAAAGDVLLGRQRAPVHHDGEHMRPYLRVANVLEGRLDLADVKEMNFSPSEFEVFSLRDGDVLLNEGQAPELLGRPAVYRGEIDGCCFQKTLLRFRPSPSVLPDFALTVFRHYMHSGRFLRESRITTNIGHLTQVRFLPIEFPLPPLDEQERIVALVREGEAAWEEHDLHGQVAAPLRQSILAAAFRGELVQ